MATSLVDTITQSMSSELISRFTATTGEPASNIKTGLSTAVRAITASAATRADDPETMVQIHAMAVDPASDLSLPDRTDGLVSRAISGSSQITSSDFIQSLLMGNRVSTMSDSLASYAGVSKATARSMFAIATSLVLSSLGKMIRTEGLDTAALSSRLATERESIVGGLPAGLSKFYPSAGATAKDVAATIPSRAPVAPTPVATTEKRRTAWTWALPAALAALVVWALASFFGHPRVQESSRDVTVPGAVGTSGFVKHELPGGVSLQFPANGTEARLLDFIKGSGRQNWFEFDRLHFETDSAVLESGSREQLSNVAAILKAYPATSVKIGGYTDNTGDPVANRQLSQERAEAVRDELHGMGIDASRLTAEGYGDQHPIADNNTAERRMQNRRVAIHVTAR